MFYVLSKIIGLIINPLIWILCLFTYSLFSKKQWRKRKYLVLGIIVTLFFSNSFILNEILYKYESKNVALSELKPQYDYGIVLSGMMWFDGKTNRTNFLSSSDRIWQAVRLYKLGKIKRILITGGKASYFKKDTVESVLLKNFLMDIGIPESDILVETMARNTRENAMFTAEILKDSANITLLLITSACHMPRSSRCFSKVGLQCDIYPTDHNSGARRFDFETLFVPNPQVLLRWNALIHEFLGMVSYKVAGYI